MIARVSDASPERPSRSFRSHGHNFMAVFIPLRVQISASPRLATRLVTSYIYLAGFITTTIRFPEW